MRKLLLALLFVSCSILRTGSVDLAALADDVEATRVLVLSAAEAKATPETLARLQELSVATLKVESALLAADQGGPIADVKSAAAAALSIAEQVIGETDGDLAFYLALAQAALKELSGGNVGAAAKALEQQ